MPHVIVEYSANLDRRVAIRGLLQALHEAVAASGVVPLGGLRTRAARREDYVIADGDPDNAFVAVTVRLAQGRDEATRAQLRQSVFDTTCAFLAEDFARNPLAITVEVEEIPAPGSLKHNNIHARLRAREVVA